MPLTSLSSAPLKLAMKQVGLNLPICLLYEHVLLSGEVTDETALKGEDSFSSTEEKINKENGKIINYMHITL